jgi:hypothetical protein
LNKDRSAKIIPACWQQSEICLNNLHIEGKKWINCGAALLTPFIHSKENNIDCFWNIDADDMMLCCDAKMCAVALQKAAGYAHANHINLLQLDVHFSVLSRYTELGSFGVSYTINYMDYMDFLESNKEVIRALKAKGIGVWNIDAIFSAVSTHEHLIETVPFYIENMYFMHTPVGVVWENEKLQFLSEPWGHWKINDKEKVNGIPVPDKNVKFDIGITQNDCISYLELHMPSLLDRFKLFAEVKQEIKQELTHIVLRKDSIADSRIFKNYVFLLFNFAPELIIFIASSDAHTPPSMERRKLRLMAAFGIQTNLEKTFRHSWLAVIDGGEVRQEFSSENLAITSRYFFGGHRAEIMSQGWNFARVAHAPVSIKIDGTEYAAGRRGLNFVVWDKEEERVIDSVCFDTWADVTAAFRQKE